MKKVTMFAACVFLVTFFVFSFKIPVHAQAGDTFGINTVGSQLPLGGEDIRVIAAKIIRIVLSLIGIIAVGIILYAGFIWMTSGGNEDKIGSAKKTLINAVIGLVIIMASFAIVQFVLSSLQSVNGLPVDSAGGRRALNFDSYIASGALGRIVKDHYPMRDQKGVKRNTRIAVTFREPIEPSSIIRDTNGNNIFGDCINVNAAGFNWGPAFCDQLSTSSVKIMVTGTSTIPIDAAALTVLEGADKNAYSFTFRPLNLLGSEQSEVDYTVDLTKFIFKKGTSSSIFSGDRHGHYVWRFRTDRNIDTDPPHVLTVYPENATAAAKNSVVQISFNEAMDPTLVQGTSAANSPFTNIIFAAQNVTGNWRVSNGYKTVEFLSDIACGQNSCGEMMYCLPVSCGDPAIQNCFSPYTVLVRSSLTFNQNSFESIPFTGVADMAGNALDNGPSSTPDGIVNRRPSFAENQAHTIGAVEKVPDNYFWNFQISNEIDRTSPYIEQVSPNLDQESVAETATLTVQFSKRMQMYSFDNVDLQEHPRPADLVTNTPAFRNLGDVWFLPRAEVVENKTKMSLSHREFGPQGTDFYYFPVVPSSVKSITQNCLYPGMGPFTDRPVAGDLSGQCQYTEGPEGALLNPRDCLRFPSPVTAQTDTACIQYSNPGDMHYRANTSTCLTFLKGADISPHESNAR